MYASIGVVSFTVALMFPSAPNLDQRARTEDGRVVILRDDGTWVYAEEMKETRGEAAALKVYSKSPNARKQYQGRRGTFALYLEPGVWLELNEQINPDAEVSFRHRDGDTLVMVIAERLQIPLQTLKQIAIDNAKAGSDRVEVVSEEMRMVNGNEILCLKMNLETQGIQFTFYNYYYSGPEGAIQVVTWTGSNLFREFEQDMSNLLNGFVVQGQE